MDEDTLQRHRHELLRIGGVMAKRLENLLAGQNVTLADLGLPGEEDDEQKKEDRLRQTVHRIDDAVKRIDVGTYGKCVDCGAPLSEGALETTPWAERCDSCEAAATTPPG